MNTPELRKFYVFYQKVLDEHQNGIPVGISRNFIFNIPVGTLKDTLRKLWPVKEEEYEDLEEISEVPLRGLRNLPADKKGRDLGNALLEFVKMSNNYREMSSILPTLRLLQDQIAYTIVPGKTVNGVKSPDEVVPRLYYKPGYPNKKIEGKDTNLHKMTEKVIEMQVLGKMQSDQGRVDLEDGVNENGEIVQTYGKNEKLFIGGDNYISDYSQILNQASLF